MEPSRPDAPSIVTSVTSSSTVSTTAQRQHPAYGMRPKTKTLELRDGNGYPRPECADLRHRLRYYQRMIRRERAHCGLYCNRFAMLILVGYTDFPISRVCPDAITETRSVP